MLHNFSRNLSLIIAALFCAIALTSVVNANNTDDTSANSDILAEPVNHLYKALLEKTNQYESDNRPNIVLFLADDTNWFDIGVYDRLYNYTPKNAITPNIDALAKEGMIFTSAFTSTAMCSPTRQQLYTGIYPVRVAHTQITVMHMKVQRALFITLRIRDTAPAGKGHIAPRSVYPFKKIGEAKDDSGASTFGIEAVSDFIEAIKTSHSLVIASHNTHGPWTRGDRSKYSAEDINVPSFMVDTPQFRNDLVRYYAETFDLDHEVGLKFSTIEKYNQKMKPYLSSRATWWYAIYLLNLTYDAGLKVVSTIIRWPTDIVANTKSDSLIQYVMSSPHWLNLSVGGSHKY